MKHPSFVVVAWSVLSALLGCGDDASIPHASCQTCIASEQMCSAWAASSGCKSSKYTAGSGSSCGSCSFSDCNEPPSCEATSLADAGSPDAALDPACDLYDPDHDGIFSTAPLHCSSSRIQINGVNRYTCLCTASCPCGYECGSISIPGGGVASNVCAPAKQ